MLSLQSIDEFQVQMTSHECQKRREVKTHSSPEMQHRFKIPSECAFHALRACRPRLRLRLQPRCHQLVAVVFGLDGTPLGSLTPGKRNPSNVEVVISAGSFTLGASLALPGLVTTLSRLSVLTGLAALSVLLSLGTAAGCCCSGVCGLLGVVALASVGGLVRIVALVTGLVARLVASLAASLVARLVASLAASLVARLVASLAASLVARLVASLAASLVARLVASLAASLVARLVASLIASLVASLVARLIALTLVVVVVTPVLVAAVLVDFGLVTSVLVTAVGVSTIATSIPIALTNGELGAVVLVATPEQVLASHLFREPGALTEQRAC